MGCCFMTVCLSDGLLFLSGGSHHWLCHCSISPTFLSCLLWRSIRRSTLAAPCRFVSASHPLTRPPGESTVSDTSRPGCLSNSLHSLAVFSYVFLKWCRLFLLFWIKMLHECINSVEPQGPPGSFSVFIMEEEEERILQVRKWCNKCISVNKATDLGCFFWLVYVFVTSLTHVLFTCFNQFHQYPNSQRSAHPKVEFWESRWIMTHHSHLGKNKIRIWRKTLERSKCTAFISI